MERAGQAAARLRDAGLRVTPLTDRALATALSDSWRPGQAGEGFSMDYWLDRARPGEYTWTLTAESDGLRTRARVTRPRYVDRSPDPDSARTTQGRRSLPRGSDKALPR
jgi:hypothetical protein